MEKLTAPLSVNMIEARIGMTSAKGFTLLLYKTARADIKRLNDSGATWRNKHEYDAMGLLTCTISIYDPEHSLWIDRVDVGTESQTEKQKGLYSDSFKRAGFRFGIGLELYNAPFIWVNWEMVQYNNKWKPKNFFGSNLDISEYEIEDGEFMKLSIKYNNNVVFSMSKISSVETNTISQVQATGLIKYAKEMNVILKSVPQVARVKKLSELTIDDYQQAMQYIKSNRG